MPLEILKGRITVDSQSHHPSFEYRQITGGSEPGVFFLPGFGANAWGERSNWLHDRCRVTGTNFVTLTYSGLDAPRRDPVSGKNLVTDVSLQRWFDDARALFDHIKPRRKILIASSFSAPMAIALARKYPRRVGGIVFVSPVVNIVENMQKTRFHKYPNDAASFMQSGFFDYAVDPYIARHATHEVPAYIRVSADMVEAAQKMSILNTEHERVDLACPIRILHDPEDEEAPFSRAYLLHRQINSYDKEFMAAKDVGHTGNRPADYEIVWNKFSSLQKAALGAGT